jgi:hypothetical protein
MAVQVYPTRTVAAPAGTYVRLHDTQSGEFAVALQCSTSTYLVGPADDATAAAAEQTAGRYFLLTTSQAYILTLDPCKFWIRGSSTNGETQVMRLH